MALLDSEEQKASAWDRLRERFSRDARDDGFADDRPRHPGLAITVCVLISAVLWFIFTMQETYTVWTALPTEVINLPEDQALTAHPPDQVRVRVRGQGFQLLRLRYNPRTVPINARRSEIALREALPELPGESLNVNPSSIALRKEPRITRTLPIRLRADISTPPTHDLPTEPTIRPDSVTVSGAESTIRSLPYWPTQRYEKTGLKDSLTVQIPLSDTLSGLVQRNVDYVTLQAVSRQFTEGARTINVNVTGAPSNEKLVTLEPSEVRVRYRVLFDEYEQAQLAPDFYATVSYNDILSDTTGRVKPNVHLPEGLSLRDVEVEPSALRYYNFLQ